MNQPDAFRPLRVVRAAPIAIDIRRFDLVDPEGAALPAFDAGAHVSVRAPNGQVRRYSLCGDPADTGTYSLAVKREAAGQGGSASMCDELSAGDLLPVSAPSNDFPLVGRPTSHLFIAGGIGITPIMAMIHHLRVETRPSWKLIYLTRSVAHTAFLEELGAPDLRPHVTLHHDQGDPARAFDLWPLLEQPRGRHLYCCGPRGLMQAVRDMAGHWPGNALHFEDFGSTVPALRAENQGFTVRLARSGREVAVAPDVSILHALHAAGVTVAHSCESGTCGSCRTILLAGEAEHRDLVLMPHEQATQMMPCVSRAAPGTDTLVLDL